MLGDTQIREAIERNVKAVSLRAGVGRGTATTTAVLRPGLDCTVTEGLCGLGLMYVPEPLGALREMRRALKPGDRAVVAVWGARPNCGWADIFPIVDRRVASDVCPMFFQLGSGENLRAHLEQAGFARVETHRLSTILSYASADDAAGAAFAGGPVAMAYSRFDGPTRDEAHAEYLESIAPFARGAGYEIPGEFVVARGERTGLL